MLHLEVINAKTQSLLQRLMQERSFKKLGLVGGTALALQIGHRKSIDLDLFGNLEIDSREVPLILKQIGDIIPLQESENIFVYLINNIKVDIVNYDYPWLNPFNKYIGYRLASLPDIAAMKLSAITGRGSKKDFIDIYFLLEHFGFEQLMDFYQQKYRDGSAFLVLKSVLYFEDAEQDEMPEMIKDVKWPIVKSTISKEVDQYIKEKD